MLHVKQLVLAFNGLGDKEMKEIAKGIKDNRTIKKLNLANNNIHEEGMTALAEALTPPEDGKEDFRARWPLG